MKRKTKILLIAVTVLVCLICLSNAVYIIIQGGGMAGLYGVNMERAQWNQEVLGLQRFIFWGWLTAGLVFDALLAVFMIRSLLAVRSGILFPKANTFLLMAASWQPQPSISSTTSVTPISASCSIQKGCSLSRIPTCSCR